MSQQKRKVVLYIASSLDGYIATQDDSLEWLFQVAGQEEADEVIAAFDDTTDTVIMGRRTFDWVIDEMKGQNPYPTKETYVYTHQNRESKDKIIYTQMEPEKLIAELRRQPGKDIWLVGGSEIIRDFLEAHLVDKIILSVAPVLLGKGIPLFKEGNYASEWVLQTTRQFGQFAELTLTKK